MDKPGYTKGPWFLINDHCVGGPIEPGWEEAGCGVAHCGMRARTAEEATANARLIAAAPDLIEALQDILEYSGGAASALDDEYVMDRARAALSKALGEGQEDNG